MNWIRPPHRHWPFWVVIIALSTILGLSLLLNITAVGLLSASPSMDHHGLGSDEFPAFAERHSYGSGTTKVVRISFSGILNRYRSSGWIGSSDPVQSILRQIRAARQDKTVSAILFEVNSPGGTVTAADEIHHELTLFKKGREDRKIVVLIHDMAASGGYYISLPADRIIAQPTALIGSIGVLMQTLNIQGLSEMIGVTDTTIKSGPNKDLLNPFQPVDPQQVKLLQHSVDAMHERFTTLILETRPISKAKLKTLADGRILTAAEAMKNKLIDSIGYFEDAFAQTAVLLGVEDLCVVTYQVEKSLFSLLMSARSPLPDWQSILAEFGIPRRFYLWRP